MKILRVSLPLPLSGADLAELVLHVCRVSLLTYVLFSVIDQIQPGFVRTYINPLVFFWVAVITGLGAVYFGDGLQPVQLPILERPGTLVTLVLGAIAAGVVIRVGTADLTDSSPAIGVVLAVVLFIIAAVFLFERRSRTVEPTQSPSSADE